MAIIRLQTETEKRKGIFYQFDTDMPPIGEGGMGKVCEGLCINEHNGSTRPVAIKFMYDDLPPSAYERARREAEIQLRNDNLVEMLGFIETHDLSPTGEVRKHYHVISELLTGVSLSDILEGKTKDRLGEDVPYAVKMLQDYQNDPEHFAQIVVVSVLSGLMALHDAGYIHRDIDPTNIMLTTDGHIKLIDFGIAKQMNTLTTGDKSLTVAGKFMGKPEYAAPELVLGDISHQNQTTDIYAVGILLYQCIVGHTPFEGARHEILERQLKAKLPLDVIKNKNLRAVIAKACEKKQESRFQTSSQMRVALEDPKSMQWGLSKQKKIGLGLFAALMIILLATTGIIVKNKQTETKAQAEKALFEKQKAQFVSSLNVKLDKANRKFEEGMDKDAENYEESLMSAYVSYNDVAETLKKNKTYNIRIDVESNIRKVRNELEKAQETLSLTAQRLSDFGEIDYANKASLRAKKIEEFLNNNK